MRLRLLAVVLIFSCCMPVIAQVKPEAASGGNSKLSFGAGVDYWKGDWGNIQRSARPRGLLMSYGTDWESPRKAIR